MQLVKASDAGADHGRVEPENGIGGALGPSERKDIAHRSSPGCSISTSSEGPRLLAFSPDVEKPWSEGRSIERDAQRPLNKLARCGPAATAGSADFRPPELRRGDAERPTEDARHVALVGEAAGRSDCLEGDIASAQLRFRALDALVHDIGVRRAAEFRAKLPREVEGAELHDAGELLQRDRAIEVFVDVFGKHSASGAA